MAGKFMLMDEAALVLGISTDELNELRKRQEVRAYRDGSTWKFHAADIERLAAKKLNGGPDNDLAIEDNLEPAIEGDESRAADMAGPATVPGSPQDLGLDLDDDELRLQDDAPRHTGGSTGGDDLSLLDDDLNLALEDSGDLSLAKPAAPAKESSDLGLDIDLALADDSAPGSSEMELASDDSLSRGAGTEAKGNKTGNVEEDEALVLAEGAEDELTFDTGDSGVSLLDDDAASAELQLEDDVDLGDSNALSSDLDVDNLILGEDIPAPRRSSMATAAVSAEDFELTPFEEADADMSESGSQVIALDSGEDFGDLGAKPAAEEDIPEPGDFGEELVPASGLGRATNLTAMAAAPASAALAEAPYTMGNVLGLGACFLLLLVVGLMMIDLMFNLGTWNGISPITSSIMDPLVSLIGG